MSVVRDLPLVFVFQVERIHVEGVHYLSVIRDRQSFHPHPRLSYCLPGVPHPHGGAVEVDQHPLVWVEVEAVCQLHTAEEGPELGTDEGAPSVGCVYVEPETLGKGSADERCEVRCVV